MVKLNDIEFEKTLESFENIVIDINRRGKNNTYYKPYDSILIDTMNFKYTDKQFSKMLDFVFQDPKNAQRVLKLLCLMDEFDFVTKSISIKSYENYLKKLVECLDMEEFECLFTEFIYFEGKKYTSDKQKRRKRLDKIKVLNLKYMDLFNFTDSATIIAVMDELKEYNYSYRGYDGAKLFNNYLHMLEKEIGLDIENLLLEDKIEEFICQKDQPLGQI